MSSPPLLLPPLLAHCPTLPLSRHRRRAHSPSDTRATTTGESTSTYVRPTFADDLHPTCTLPMLSSATAPARSSFDARSTARARANGGPARPRTCPTTSHCTSRRTTNRHTPSPPPFPTTNPRIPPSFPTTKRPITTPRTRRRCRLRAPTIATQHRLLCPHLPLLTSTTTSRRRRTRTLVTTPTNLRRSPASRHRRPHRPPFPTDPKPTRRTTRTEISYPRRT